jgi:hypothetical protein
MIQATEKALPPEIYSKTYFCVRSANPQAESGDTARERLERGSIYFLAMEPIASPFGADAGFRARAHRKIQ